MSSRRRWDNYTFLFRIASNETLIKPPSKSPSVMQINVFNSTLELYEKFKPTPLVRLSIERRDVFCQAGVL